MTTRDLIVSDDEGERPVGSVTTDSEGAQFAGQAIDVFARLRARHGDVAVAERLVAEGWSNGMGSMRLGPGR